MPIDLRGHSEMQLAAPHPLPYLSRKSIRRVANPLQAPTECPYCNSGEVVLVSNSEIYGKEYGDWPYTYLCKCCKAYVGVHPGTDIPLGTLANKTLREARKTAKAKFFAVQKYHGWSRTQAYQWLANAMGLPRAETHFGWFNEESCDKATALCNAETRGTVFMQSMSTNAVNCTGIQP